MFICLEARMLARKQSSFNVFLLGNDAIVTVWQQ